MQKESDMKSEEEHEEMKNERMQRLKKQRDMLLEKKRLEREKQMNQYKNNPNVTNSL